jgi:hypothetical protein
MCRLLIGKPEGKRPLGRPRFRRLDNIKMDLGEIGCGGVDWIVLAQDAEKWGKLSYILQKPLCLMLLASQNCSLIHIR